MAARWRSGGATRAWVAAAAFAFAWTPTARTEAADADDRATAQALVRALEQDAAHRAVTADALASAKEAIERAQRLRDAGDEAHARAADGLAREWAETASDVARAADAEAKAAEIRHAAVAEQAKLERTRALVETGLARVGRLKTELDEVERDDAGNTAVELHEGDHGAATRPTKKKARPANGPAAR